MDTAEIHHQLAVDEDPRIIIAAEGELLTPMELEPEAGLSGEMIIVVGAQRLFG